MALPESQTFQPASVLPKAPPALPRIHAWFSAINCDDMELLEDLSTHGIPTDILHPLHHTTALMEATRLGRANTVKWLLTNGAAPALLCGLPKGTPLHCALRRKHWQVAELLIESMENIALIDAYGCTPLHALCIESQDRNDQKAAVTLASRLIDRGCPLDALDHEGITALHYSVLNDSMQLADTLLSHGANPNAMIPDTWVSPLVVAALEKNAPMAHLLVQYHADPHQKTRDGSTPAGIYPALIRHMDA